MQKKSFILIAFLLIPFSGYCQLLDDTTKLIYSAKTTSLFSLDDVLNNSTKKNAVDTSLLDLHNYNFYFRNHILYQDLGNYGTPINRIYVEPSVTIGKNLGLNTLTEYGYNSDKITYYNTRSPFTQLYYIQGSRGQQSLELGHTQNIKPHWNVGFLFKRMTATKQIAVKNGKELQLSHYSFASQTSYFSKNNRYKFLFNVTLLDHAQYETGGIFVDTTETKKDMFDYKLEKTQLYSLPNSHTSKLHLRSYIKTTNFKFYNEYALNKTKKAHLFHQFDYRTTTNRYDDDYLYDPYYVNNNAPYYPITKYDTIHTQDRTFQELYENKLGIKGSISKLYYLGYYRQKDFSYIQSNYADVVVRKFEENFIGGKLDYRFNDTTTLSFNAEYYLGKDYLLKAEYLSKYIETGYSRIFASPTLFQLENVSNSYQWANNFTNTTTDFAYVKGKFNKGNLLFSPFIKYTNISHMVYYNEMALPTQSAKSVQQSSIGFIGRINYRAVYIENYLHYTKLSGADIIRVPALFNQTKFYVNGPLFKKALRVQLGVDLSWKSGYYGNTYSPATQQFHISDKSSALNYLDGYLLADVFLNTQIKRAYIFLKLSHANMGLPKPGYFITPYYTAMPRSFEFGIKWLFYD